MAAKPLTMLDAWKTYDRFLSDERVEFAAESLGIDPVLRNFSGRGTASPKLWADAFLPAFAAESGGVLVTFDQAVARRAEHVLLLS
jgi:predicted nucleic acid-binding protein